MLRIFLLLGERGSQGRKLNDMASGTHFPTKQEEMTEEKWELVNQICTFFYIEFLTKVVDWALNSGQTWGYYN